MHVAMEGMDAVGKTTAARMLAEKLGMHYCSKSLHDMTDPSGIYDSFITLRELSLSDSVNSSFGFRGSFLLDRCLRKPITSDRFLASNFWAHTRGRRFEELRPLLETAGEPDLTVILYAAPEVIRERMVHRDPNDKDIAKLPFQSEGYAAMRWFAERCGLNCIWLDTSEMTVDQVVSVLSDFISGHSLPSNGYLLPTPGLRQCEAGGSRYAVLDGNVLKRWTAGDEEVLRVPEGIQELRPFSLSHCDKIKELHLPADVRRASSLSFVGMDALEHIEVSPRNRWLQSVDGVLYSRDTSRLIKYPPAKDCRRFCAAAGLIDNMAFYNAGKLEALELTSTLKKVGFGAFYGCAGLKEIVFDGPVDVIGQCAFLRTSPGLAFRFPKGGRYDACGGCVIDRAKDSIYFVPPDARTIAPPGGARQLGPWAAAYTQQTETLCLDAPVRRIGPYAFAGSDCSVVALPAAVEEIDDSVFLNCRRLHTLEMRSPVPPALTSLSFDGCFLKRIAVPDAAAYEAARRWEAQKQLFISL